MDPFSLITGVVGLIAVITQVTGYVDGYVKGVHDRRQDVRDLHHELLLLGSTLSQLRDFISSEQAKDASFDPGSVLRAAVANCSRRIERVGDRLKPATGGRVARTVEKLRWPFEQDEVKKLTDTLQRFVQTFTFALTTHGLSVLSKTSAAAEAALRQQHEVSLKMIEMCRTAGMPTAASEAQTARYEEILAILPSLLSQASDIREMSHHLRLQEEREQAQQKSEILEWLVPASTLKRHLEMQRKRVSNTCQWFLHSQFYRKWQTLDVPAHDMLCTGPPGVGKSVLVSFIIDQLRSTYPSEHVVTLNYYCSHFDVPQQSPSHFPRVLLRQLCQFYTRLPSAVIDFYRDTLHHVEDLLWSRQLERVLYRVLSTCDHVFLVIDALDEVEDNHQRIALLKVLQEIRSSNVSFRVLATSRPHLSSLHTYLHNAVVIDVSARQDDVRESLQHRLAQHPELELLDDLFRQEIMEKLSSNSSGSFLLPALQLDNVLQQLTKSDMRRALNTLSETLEEAYRTSLERIRGLPVVRRDLAFRAMMWVSLAKRPLRMDELQHALSIRENEREIDADSIVPARFIIESCAGLVQLDQESRIVTFVHFSVDEYLRSQDGEFLTSELLITRACLRYLLQPLLGKTRFMSKEEFLDVLEGMPFFRYAANSWGFHAKQIPAEQYSDLALLFVGNTLNVLAVSRLQDMENPYARNWEKRAAAWAYSGVAGISIAAYFGLADLVTLLLNDVKDKSIINTCRNVNNKTVVQTAAGYGHTDVCEVLIAHGADLMDNNEGRVTAFYHAVTYGRLETAQALLKHNVQQLHVPCHGGWTALHKAAELKDETMVRVLLQEGALATTTDLRHRTALHIAAARGHTAIVEMLAFAGADINGQSREEMPLDMSCTSGHLDTVRFLLAHGAFVNNRGRDSWTPLLRACRGGHVEVVELLLRAGADVTYQDRRKNTCLHMAARSGDLRLVKVLLDYDPMLTLRLLKQCERGGRNAQIIALITSHVEVYKFLRDLENQLEVDKDDHQIQSYSPIISLAQAIEARDSITVETLVDQMPELLGHADSYGQLPIHTAFIECAPQIASLFLASGASIHSAGFHGWQPLHIAASIGSLQMTELALSHGADVQAKTGTDQTPLQKAASSDSVPVLRRLLEAGADPWARNDRGMTCLHIAASKNRIEGLREILQSEWGAQSLIHVKDGQKQLPSDWAARGGHLEAVTFLRLQGKLIPKAEFLQTDSWSSTNPDSMTRTNTSASQISMASPPPSARRTPSSFAIEQEADQFLKMALELDSE